MTKSIYTILLLFISVCYSTAQDDIRFPFERVYTAPLEDHLTLDMDTLPGGGFITLALEQDVEEKFKRMNVTSFDKKGNINWSKTYEYKRDQELLPIGEIIRLPDDSLAFSVAIDTTIYNRVVTTISNEGDYGSSLLYHTEGQAEVNFEGKSELVELLSEGTMHVTNVFTESGNDIMMTIIDSSGELSLIKTLDDADGDDDMIVDATTTVDSMVLLLSNTSSNFVITKTDRMGNVLWSKSYESPLDTYVSTLANNVAVLSNGEIAVVAESVLAGGGLERNIIHLDESGELISGFNITSIGNNISLEEVGGIMDSTIVIAGYRSTEGEEGEPYMAHLRRDSTISWASYYFRGLRRTELGFATLNDGGASLYVTGGTRQTIDIETPYLITVGPTGRRNTACVQQNFTIDLDFADFLVTPVTLTERTLPSLTDTISVEELAYGGFSPPVLQLPDTSFCPDDPINVLLDATQPGGIAYIWSDETPQPATTMATVTEEGMYSVTVTINRDLCFVLCDTANITRKELPMVEIMPNFDGYCENGEALLIATANNAIQTIQWSTGSADDSKTRIRVTEPGTYRVTITDDCDETATGAVSLGSADFDIDFPLTAQLDRSPLCETGMIQIALTNFTGDVNGLTWSTGATGVPSIMVGEAGTYSVDFTSFCSGSTSIDVSQDDFLQEASISVTRNCGNNSVNLLSSSDNIESVIWSNGETTSAISVTTAGNYTVTGLDICGEEYVAEYEVTQDDLIECNVLSSDACLQFPNAFVPRSDTELNQTFAPKNNCGNLESYQLSIYSRWGNRTFSTENINEGWNGFKGSKEAPADVYYFSAKYTNDGIDFEKKGDLLLIR